GRRHPRSEEAERGGGAAGEDHAGGRAADSARLAHQLHLLRSARARLQAAPDQLHLRRGAGDLSLNQERGMAEAKSAGRIEAAATVSGRGWGGEVSGESGMLKAETATQVELGGPGQATNPEELLAAALANCYTSTITAHARAKKIDLASLETRARTRL